jgi:hypothetical protein
MININTVYQKVLAIINKENRGYLTPQEFNLFANQAQIEIFEQYFFDLNQYKRLATNNTEYADLYKITDEKLSKFKKEATLIYSTDSFQIPSDLHKLGTLTYNNIQLEKVDKKTLNEYVSSKLTTPTVNNPLYIQSISNSALQWNIKVYPTSIISGVECTYVRKPSAPQWGYTQVDGSALYNAGQSQDFELHSSEETNVVLKILLYTGVSIKDPNITQISDAKETKKITQEKS